MDVEFEEGPSSDDLESWQNDAGNVHVRDEHVAGHLADVLKEAEVLVLVLYPRKFQVTVHVRAVGIPVPQVSVVVLPV